MQSSEAVKSVFQDTHLLSTSLNRPEPTRYTKTTTNQRPRPVSAPPASQQPRWRHPNSPEPKRARKFHVSLYHTPFESKTSKKAPFAPRATIGGSSTLRGKDFSPATYNSLSDPHLNPYFSRKFGKSASLRESGPSKTRGRRSTSGKTKKKGGVTFKTVVKTGAKRNGGTDAKVFAEFRGTKGKFTRQLTHQMDSAVPSAFIATLPPFQFHSGSTETFTVKGPDIGDLIQLIIQHDGRERKQGWFLDEIQVTNPQKSKSWTFPCYQWLSLYESDCQVKRCLKPLVHKKAEKVVYVIEVYTGDKAGAGTDAHVFITLYGKRGQAPKTQLISRTDDAFERKKKDVFKIKTTDLGSLKKLTVEHDSFGFSPGWFLDKIIVYCREREDQKFYFPCNQWLAKDEGDGMTRRQLTASTDSSAVFQGHRYLVHTYTGDKRGAGTDANVVITIFGEDGDSGEKKLDNARNNFERGKKDSFKVICGTSLGRLTKIRIGHDNSGLGPGWFLNKATVEDPSTGEAVDFPCRRWFAKNEDDGQISRELIRADAKDGDLVVDKGIPYHIHVTTGDVRNASTNARVYVILHGGEDGENNSGKLWLQNEEKDNFQRGRTDIFTVETAEMLSPLHHLTIGHDNSGLGAGWHCEKVVVDCPSSGDQQVFLCQKWLADDEGDQLIERDLFESEDMRLKRRPKTVWNVWLWTSDMRGAGTDANVFMTLYGDKGKTDEVPLGNATDNFEQGQLDKFKVELTRVGKPYKLRIRHDNSKGFSDWHLEKIQMENVKSSIKCSYKCNRWLSKSEDDHQIIRELPAIIQGKEPLPVYVYHVYVHTGDKRGAGTNANIFLNIFGELGDTGDRPLEESKTNRNKFERNQVDEFLIEAVSLKTLEKVRVGHDSTGPGSGWFLDKVVIKDPEDNTKEYVFPCNRWLAKDEDDGLIVRELPLGGTSLLNTTSYLVSVRTGDVRGAGTDANVFVQIFGAKGDTGKLQLRSAENTKNKFERSRTDQFVLEAVDIGKVEMLRISHDNKGGAAGWFLDNVTVDIPSRGEHVVFPCHRWLADDEDDGKIERELYPGQQTQSNPKIPHEVTVYTGDVRGAGTNANVFLVIYGENGKSDQFDLRNKSDNFERGQVDKFKVECEDIGQLVKIRVGHDNNGMRSAWFLEKVEIRRVKPEDKEPSKKRRNSGEVEEMGDGDEHNYLFVCNRWLARDEDDGQIVRELVPVDSSGRPRRGSLAENTYRVHVHTGDVSNAGTNSNVFICLYGEFGDSGERKLDKSETHMDKFERNNEDIFSFNCVNLGPLSKVKVWHDNSGLKSAWHLDRIEIEDKLAEEKHVFPCNRWLATSEDDGQICRELVKVDERALKLERKRTLSRKTSVISNVDGVDLEAKARITTYEVSVSTGDVRGAGTNANVYVIMYGAEGDTGKVPLKTSKTFRNKFERGQTDVFTVDAKVGEIEKIRIGHDNRGGFAGWFLDKVIIDVPSLGQKAVFPCGRWLDKGKDDGQLERELFPGVDTEEAYSPYVPYEMTVFTSDVMGAGTSAHVYIVLYGSDGCTEEIMLADTSKKQKDSFKRGSTDQFVKELDNVGDVIEKIRIGHDNKGMTPGWHLDKVEVRRLKDDGESSTTYTFPCKRWLAKDEDDGSVVRELIPNKVIEESVTEDGEVETKEVDQETLELRKYKVHVFTGDVKGAGTDANVFITLYGEYGDTGERQLAKSETYSNKFERGNEDIFTLEAAELGNVFKVKLRHDNANFSPSWFVDRVDVRDLETDKLYPFVCERWLSKKKEEGKIQRTLYVKGYQGERSTLGTMSLRSLSQSSLSPRRSSRGSLASSRGSLGRSNESLPTANRSATADAIFMEEFGQGDKDAAAVREAIAYTIRVTTGDQSDAGTKAQAHIVLIGSEAATEKIPLALIQRDGFTPGLTETFSVEAVDVGEVKKVEISNNGYGADSGWFVKEVEVDVPTSGKKYFFPCNRWLSQNKEDGKVVRVLSASDDHLVTYKPHVQFEIEVYTGDVKSAGTDSTISMTMFGTDGTTPEVVLDKDESRFERGGVDLIKMDLYDVGKLLKVRIAVDGKGTRHDWFLEKIIIRNMETHCVSVFKSNQWFSKTEGDGKLVKEIPAEVDGEELLKRTSYKVNVKTGDVLGAGTDANVFMVIFGEHGDSGELALKNSETYKDKFERNHTDVFSFKNFLSLGELTKVRIWHDNKFLKANWFLESVEIINESNDEKYLFPCNRWLAKDKDDGSLVRELTCANAKKSTDSRAPTTFELTFLTSDKQNAGTTQNAWIVLEGEERKSQEYPIENSAKNKVLRRGQTDTFKFATRSLGNLTHVTLGHRRRQGSVVKGTGKETGWFLHELIVTNPETGEKYVFPCRQWIPLSDDKNDAVRLECKSSEKPKSATIRDLHPVQYLIEVFTADVAHAGTDANVSILLYGANGDTGQRQLTKKFVNLFERGKVDDFKIEALDLGQLTRLRIEHDNKGFGAGWMLEKVDITNLTSQEKVTFPCSQWLDKKKGDGKICRDLLPLTK